MVKKGNIPWNKGMSGLKPSWNKGLDLEDERVKKARDNRRETMKNNPEIQLNSSRKQSETLKDRYKDGSIQHWAKGMPKEEFKKHYPNGMDGLFKKGFNLSPETEFKKGHIQLKEVLEKRGKSIKKFWKMPENKEKLVERGKKIGKKVKGQKRPDDFVNHRKGVSFEKQYGKEKAGSIKKKMSVSVKKTMTPERIKQIIIARSTQIVPKKDTSIEVKMQRLLKELGIEFYTHQYMKEIEHSYQCDILIPKQQNILRKTVIECHGDYWHKRPYGNPLDTTRANELRKKGWRVLIFWESEIKPMELNDLKMELII